MDATQLSQTISAVCPILSAHDDGQGAWNYSCSPLATADQIAAANALLDEINTTSPPVPQSVKMWQAKAALALAGKLDAANAAVAAAGDAISIAWDYASDISRSSAAVTAMAQAIGMTEADLDAMFITARKVVI